MPAFDEATGLRYLLSATAGELGNEFFDALVVNLARVFNIDFAWVTEYVPQKGALRAVAFFQDGKVIHDYEYDLGGTPCEPVINEARLIHHPTDVQGCYPGDTDLQDLGMVGYLGLPLLSTGGQVLGHMAIMDRKPMPEQADGLGMLKLFASRATAELQRMQAEKVIAEHEVEQARLNRELQEALKTLGESETRFRDLFDEAPIAYVNEGLDSRFIRANKTALKILGIPADEAVGFLGRSLAPEGEAQQRVDTALESISGGKDASGVILELRRYDNGEPVWVRWWSKPDPSGAFTRTMFIDVTETIVIAKEKAALEAQNAYLQEELDSTSYEDIVGKSTAFRRVLDDVHQVAVTDANVLILGETGTGKEVIAGAVHSASSRSQKPLIKVNCAALPESLIESELFGHEKGAFTGATSKREGRFKLADGGTIFLDEIGEMPLLLQAKLLRVLQEGEFEPLGSARTQSVDVRVVAATNRDLFKAVQDGEFREDLNYRLAVFPIEIPPLRDRMEDIPAFVEFFFKRFCRDLHRQVAPPSESDLNRLLAYHWPGNIRELQNVIERAIIPSYFPSSLLQSNQDIGTLYLLQL